MTDQHSFTWILWQGLLKMQNEDGFTMSTLSSDILNILNDPSTRNWIDRVILFIFLIHLAGYVRSSVDKEWEKECEAWYMTSVEYGVLWILTILLLQLNLGLLLWFFIGIFWMTILISGFLKATIIMIRTNILIRWLIFMYMTYRMIVYMLTLFDMTNGGVNLR